MVMAQGQKNYPIVGEWCHAESRDLRRSGGPCCTALGVEGAPPWQREVGAYFKHITLVFGLYRLGSESTNTERCRDRQSAISMVPTDLHTNCDPFSAQVCAQVHLTRVLFGNLCAWRNTGFSSGAPLS